MALVRRCGHIAGRLRTRTGQVVAVRSRRQPRYRTLHGALWGQSAVRGSRTRFPPGDLGGMDAKDDGAKRDGSFAVNVPGNNSRSAAMPRSHTACSEGGAES